MTRRSFLILSLSAITAALLMNSAQAKQMQEIKIKQVDKYETLVDKQQQRATQSKTPIYDYLFGDQTDQTDQNSLTSQIQDLPRSQRYSNKRLGASSNEAQEFSIQHPDASVWVTSVYLGENKEEFKVILDTATDLFAISGANCFDCEGPKFDISADLESENAKMSQSKIRTSYGERELHGNQVLGTVCLDLSVCAEEFPYLYLSSSKGIFNEHISGVVGMARPREFVIAPDQDQVDPSRLIMQAAKESTVFTLSFGTGASLCDFSPKDPTCKTKDQTEEGDSIVDNSDNSVEGDKSVDSEGDSFSPKPIDTEDNSFKPIDPAENTFLSKIKSYFTVVGDFLDEIKDAVDTDDTDDSGESNSVLDNTIIDDTIDEIEIVDFTDAVRVKDDFFWSSETTAVRFGNDQVDAYAFPIDENYSIPGPKGVYSIFDTGATSIYLSNLWYDDFMSKLQTKAEVEFEPYQGFMYFRCIDNMPSLFFLVDNKWIELAAKDYTTDVSRNQDRSICVVHIVPTTSPFIIFGMPLFVDYTSTFDDKQGKITLIPVDGSDKNQIQEGKTPTDAAKIVKMITMHEINPQGEMWAFRLAYGATIAYVGAASFGIWYFYWPEWKNDSLKWYYLAASYTLVLVTSILNYSITWEMVFLEISPIPNPNPNIEQPEGAIQRVRIGHVTVLAMLSYALKKLCATKTKQNQKQ